MAVSQHKVSCLRRLQFHYISLALN
uniref:Uncharacterized protein n=1 Tax=Anguilla anguilla TaxID=7936 RepID=A0A0E9PIB5_ANGAN